MRWPAYPEYKPSGVEWLGDVPVGWEVKRLSRVASCLDRRRVPLNREERSERQGPYPYWGANGILDHIDDWLFDEPLVLLGEDGAPFFAVNKEVAFFVTGKIWVNNHAHILRLSPDIDGRFLTHVLNRTEYGAFIDGSTRDKLTQDDMNSIPVVLPDSDEQTAIANFLDRETGKIDTLVAKNRTLIERLKEKRTALISSVVTGKVRVERRKTEAQCETRTDESGIPAADSSFIIHHSSFKTKPSGVEWLGEVPEEWEVKGLGRVVSFAGGATPDKNKPEYWEGNIPWVSPKDMKRRRIIDVPDHVSLEALANSPLRLFPPGSVLIVVRGMILAHSFPVAINEVPVTINQDMKALRVTREIDAEYLAWLLTGADRVFVSRADESAHGTRKLDTNVLAKISIPVPPPGEQTAIADFLDAETSKSDTLISKVETTVERLKEYRTALITAAVTGKIDLRDN